MTDVCLVLIETSGNQRFIFDTRKLRENVGASEAIHRATGQTVIHAARSLRGETGACPSAESWILDPSANPPIEDAAAPAEVIIAASGKALVLVRDPEVGRTLVATVTETAIRTTPGLAARGAVSAPFPFGVNRLHGEIKALHRTLEHVETDLAGQAGRFQALPLSQTCATSGLPAAGFLHPLGAAPTARQAATLARSAVSLGKTRLEAEGWARIRASLGEVGPRLCGTLRTLETLFGDADPPTPDGGDGEENENERGTGGRSEREGHRPRRPRPFDWLSVIHADGNGLGEFFLSFDRTLAAAGLAADDRAYVTALRQVSLALDRCTVQAMVAALKGAAPDETRPFLPVVPLVLGGDDLTVLCDGAIAVPLARDFLSAFTAATKRDLTGDVPDALRGILPKLTRGKGLGCCAGVVVVKPHYPFHAAYAMAEGLLSSAKTIKERVRDAAGATIPAAALDYHIHFDSSGADIGAIRERLTRPDRRLFTRPYVITPLEDLAEATDEARQWASGRSWADLERAIAALPAFTPADDDPSEAEADAPIRLHGGPVHALRAALFLGSAAASESRLDLLRDRLPEQPLNALLGVTDAEREAEAEGESARARTPVARLFHASPDGLGGTIKTTRLLDAMDLRDILPRAPSPPDDAGEIDPREEGAA